MVQPALQDEPRRSGRVLGAKSGRKFYRVWGVAERVPQRFDVDEVDRRDVG